MMNLGRPDNTVEQVALPAEATDASFENRPLPSLIGSESGLLAIFQRSVWNLDTETEAWIKLLDLPAEASTISDYLSLIHI